MRRILPLLVLAIVVALPATADSRCSFCTGFVIDSPAGVPAVSVPTLLMIDRAALGQLSETLSQWSAARKRELTLVVTLAPEGDDAILAADRSIEELVRWAEQHGPFDGIGVTLPGLPASVESYAVKKLSVSAEGRGVAGRIVVPFDRPDRMEELRGEGAWPYIDVMLIALDDLASRASAVFAHDPSKEIWAYGATAEANAFYAAAEAFAAGARRAFLAQPATEPALRAAARLNQALSGDFAYDGYAAVSLLAADGTPLARKPLAFVRGEDLRGIIAVPALSDRPVILSLSDDAYRDPMMVGAEGEAAIGDTGRANGRFLIGIQPQPAPFAIAVRRPPVTDPNIAREEISVVTQRSIPVEEIVRRHQAYRDYQATIMPPYVARNETKLRFAIGQGGDAVEATLAGDHFFSDHLSDWVWSDLLINGVRWKYGRIPELPLVQPEKVTRLPLDIHLTRDYDYRLAGEAKIGGVDAWEVRFEPPVQAPRDLPLYRGTVWIDKRSWARLAISMIQLNLKGEILSNEERVEFVPFARPTGAPLTLEEAAAVDPADLLWLPSRVNAQQVLSTAGRATVILRETTFSSFRLSPDDFDQRHQEASGSSSRMVRDTDGGLRYLEKNDEGVRVVKNEFDTSRLFLLGGIHHDGGLEFPVVPLGGVNYFDFNLLGRGLQTNVFFAGIMTAATVSDPALGASRWNAGADLFAIALPFENTMRRDGEQVPGETVRARPINLSLRAGHPFAGFGKIDFTLGLSHLAYSRADDTSDDFAIPSSTFVVSPGVDVRYDRRGWSLSAFYEHAERSSWETWGDPAEFDDAQSSFDRFGASIGKSFYLPRFQRVGVEMNYFDGADLDRFSRYELGFFGGQRVRGIESGSVRADRAILGHLSYGFVFSEQFRLELFYDHALVDDPSSGIRREPFQGVGFGGQTVGPWGTLLRFDVGKTIGPNAQDDFVANIVFLKLFG